MSLIVFWFHYGCSKVKSPGFKRYASCSSVFPTLDVHNILGFPWKGTWLALEMDINLQDALFAWHSCQGEAEQTASSITAAKVGSQVIQIQNCKGSLPLGIRDYKSQYRLWQLGNWDLKRYPARGRIQNRWIQSLLWIHSLNTRNHQWYWPPYLQPNHKIEVLQFWAHLLPRTDQREESWCQEPWIQWMLFPMDPKVWFQMEVQWGRRLLNHRDCVLILTHPTILLQPWPKFITERWWLFGTTSLESVQRHLSIWHKKMCLTLGSQLSPTEFRLLPPTLPGPRVHWPSMGLWGLFPMTELHTMLPKLLFINYTQQNIHTNLAMLTTPNIQMNFIHWPVRVCSSGALVPLHVTVVWGVRVLAAQT